MFTQNLKVYAIVTLAMLFWSLTYVWYKVVFETLNPVSVMVFRLSFSGVFLLVVARIRGRFKVPLAADWGWFLLLALFQPFLYFLCESYGVSLVTTTISAVIISTIPVFTPIMAYLFYGHKISRFNLLGLVVSFAGVLLVVLGRQFHFDGSVTGILLLSGAVLAALGFSVVIIKLMPHYSTFTIIGWQNILGAIMFLPLFFILDWPTFSLEALTPRIVLNLFYLALFGSSAAYVCFTYGIKHLGVSKASMFTNTIPVFTAIFAYLGLGETIDVVQGLGIAIVLAGLFMGQTNGNPLKQAM